MKISLFRLYLSSLILVIYLVDFALLGIGTISFGIAIDDAKQIAANISPLFVGYITAILGFYLAAAETRRNFKVPLTIACVVLAGAVLSCGSVPLLIVGNFLNHRPLALLPDLLAILGIVQSVIGVFVGIVVTLIIIEKRT
jgi:hypothetical protein